MASWFENFYDAAAEKIDDTLYDVFHAFDGHDVDASASLQWLTKRWEDASEVGEAFFVGAVSGLRGTINTVGELATLGEIEEVVPENQYEKDMREKHPNAFLVGQAAEFVGEMFIGAGEAKLGLKAIEGVKSMGMLSAVGKGISKFGKGAMKALGIGGAAALGSNVAGAVAGAFTETVHGIQCGQSSSGIGRMSSKGYDFAVVYCKPTPRDIQAIDDYFTAYGYRVDKFATPKIDFSKNKGNNGLFYLKVGESCCTSSVREAQLQLDAMCMSGCRFWAKEIGA